MTLIILKHFFERPEQLEISDHIFGRMKYRGDNSWDVLKPIVLRKHEVNVWVDLNKSSPTEAQRKLFSKIISDYNLLYPKILEKLIENNKELGIKKSRVDKLYPSILFIPQEKGNVLTWKIWFQNEKDEIRSYGVEIVNWNKITPFLDD